VPWRPQFRAACAARVGLNARLMPLTARGAPAFPYGSTWASHVLCTDLVRDLLADPCPHVGDDNRVGRCDQPGAPGTGRVIASLVRHGLTTLYGNRGRLLESASVPMSTWGHSALRVHRSAVARANTCRLPPFHPYALTGESHGLADRWREVTHPASRCAIPLVRRLQSLEIWMAGVGPLMLGQDTYPLS